MTDRELLEQILAEVREIKQLQQLQQQDNEAQSIKLLGTEINAVMVQAEKVREHAERTISELL